MQPEHTQKKETFLQAVSEKYFSNQLASATAVYALTWNTAGVLFLGTNRGVLYLNGSRFVELLGDFDCVTSLYAAPDGGIYAAAGRQVLYIGPQCRIEKRFAFDSEVFGIDGDGVGDRVWAVTENGILVLEEGAFVPVEEITFSGISAFAVTRAGEPYAAVDAGLMMLHGKRPRWGMMTPALTNTPAVPFYAIAPDALGMLWLGGADGVYIYDGKNEWVAPDALPAFPKCPIRSIAFCRDSGVLVGTDAGLYLVDGEKTRFYGCARYLPGDRVYMAKEGPDGKIYAACDGGLAVLSFVPMTLADKAAFYERLLPQFTREGFVTKRVQTVNGDPATGVVAITDNDGLYSADQLAAQSLRYAVTGAPDAREAARVTMEAMLHLHEISGIPGFPARAYRRPGEDRFGDGDPEWHRAADAKGALEWKGETSSDELVGHFYALCWYYDLCADAEEKRRIADALKKVTDHILSHGYTLCDTDGKPTTWAHFGPADLNDDAKWCWEKGVNSLELLAFLRVTSHMTGDAAYLEVQRRFSAGAHYAMNLLYCKRDDAHSSHIDDKLCFYIVTHLLRLETDETLLRYLRLGLRRHYEYIRFEHCPFYTYIYKLSGGAHADLDAARQVMEEYPLDLRGYRVRNSIRADVALEERTALFGEAPHAKEPLPVGERVTDNFLVNAMRLDAEDRGMILSPAAWLHTYWLGRYLGYLS